MLDQTTTAKLSPAQQQVIQRMKDGCQLSESLSLYSDSYAVRYRHGTVRKNNGIRFTVLKNVNPATIDVLLRNQAIYEVKRTIAGVGMDGDRPFKTWNIIYHLPPTEADQLLLQIVDEVFEKRAR